MRWSPSARALLPDSYELKTAMSAASSRTLPVISPEAVAAMACAMRSASGPLSYPAGLQNLPLYKHPSGNGCHEAKHVLGRYRLVFGSKCCVIAEGSEDECQGEDFQHPPEVSVIA